MRAAAAEARANVRACVGPQGRGHRPSGGGPGGAPGGGGGGAGAGAGAGADGAGGGGGTWDTELKFECQMYKVRDDEYLIDVQVSNWWGRRLWLSGHAALAVSICAGLAAFRQACAAHCRRQIARWPVVVRRFRLATCSPLRACTCAAVVRRPVCVHGAGRAPAGRHAGLSPELGLARRMARRARWAASGP